MRSNYVYPSKRHFSPEALKKINEQQLIDFLTKIMMASLFNQAFETTPFLYTYCLLRY